MSDTLLQVDSCKLAEWGVAKTLPEQNPKLPRTTRTQWMIITVALAVAFGLLTLGAIYQAPSNNGPVLSGGAVDGGGDRNDPATGTEELDINPIEAFLPESGIGSTCSEPVGVDLIPGWSATLRINGVDIAEEEMTSGIGTAGGSLGQFTYGPEEDCPNGRILRPRGNVLEACVYRNTDGVATCRVFSFPFDAL